MTRPVVEHARRDLEFERIADVRLKGFDESTEIFIARERELEGRVTPEPKAAG